MLHFAGEMQVMMTKKKGKNKIYAKKGLNYHKTCNNPVGEMGSVAVAPD